MLEERDPRTYAIIGACYAVHAEKGCGFFEPVYQECLAIECELREIPFERELAIDLYYKGRLLGKKYIADFVCFAEVLVELKAVQALEDCHSSQVINYLKASGLQKALLVNFGRTSLEFKRFVN